MERVERGNEVDGTEEEPESSDEDVLLGVKLQIASGITEALVTTNAGLGAMFIRGRFDSKEQDGSTTVITHKDVAGRVAEYVNELVDGLLGK